jgi:hypothetical protein
MSSSVPGEDSPNQMLYSLNSEVNKSILLANTGIHSGLSREQKSLDLKLANNWGYIYRGGFTGFTSDFATSKTVLGKRPYA